MIPLTERKLREAQFFLARLIEESKRRVRNEPEAFEFFLSALLGAGRSVTWVLQHEAKARYDQWFPGWLNRLSDDDRELFQYLKGQRNLVQKEGGAEVAFEWSYIPLPELPTGKRMDPAIGFTWSAMPGTEPPAIGIPVHSFSSESTGGTATEVCERYVKLLSKLVHEFVSEHPSAAAG